MQIELVTPTRKLFSVEAESVTFTAELGEMTVMPGHIPMVTALRPGPLTLKGAAGNEVYAVGGGMAQIDQGRVSILAESAERSDEIDITRAEAARVAAEQALREQSAYDTTFAGTRAALARAATRITIAQR